MTHPHQLHALAALASLRQALPSLDTGIDRERYGSAHVSDGIRSWQPGVGGSGSGGHGDPVAQAVTGSVRDKHARRARWTADTLRWLATRLHLDTTDPVPALQAAIPALRPPTAYHLARWLRDLDERVRETAGLGDGLEPLAAVECSACRVRIVYRTPGGMLVCRNEACVCAGAPCSCTMPVRAAGVAHIWAAA